MEYLVVPGQTIGTQSTAGGVSTLHVEGVEVEAAELPAGVVDHPCRTEAAPGRLEERAGTP